MNDKDLKWKDFDKTQDIYTDVDMLINNDKYLKQLIEDTNLDDINNHLTKLDGQITDIQGKLKTNSDNIDSIKAEIDSIKSAQTDIYNQIKLKANQSDLDNANKLIQTKQDLLDTKNAGTNITITKAKDGVTPLINAQVQIPDIDGNKIHGTINGNDKVLVEAIANNENGISTNKQLINANTTAIATKANQADLDTTNKNVSSNTTAITTKANQADLDTTNKNVSSNTNKINKYHNQSPLFYETNDSKDLVNTGIYIVMIGDQSGFGTNVYGSYLVNTNQNSSTTISDADNSTLYVIHWDNRASYSPNHPWLSREIWFKLSD